MLTSFESNLIFFYPGDFLSCSPEFMVVAVQYNFFLFSSFQSRVIFQYNIHLIHCFPLISILKETATTSEVKVKVSITGNEVPWRM